MNNFNQDHWIIYLVFKLILFFFILTALLIGFDLFYNVLHTFAKMTITFNDFVLEPYLKF